MHLGFLEETVRNFHYACADKINSKAKKQTTLRIDSGEGDGSAKGRTRYGLRDKRNAGGRHNQGDRDRMSSGMLLFSTDLWLHCYCAIEIFGFEKQII